MTAPPARLRWLARVDSPMDLGAAALRAEHGHELKHPGLQADFGTEVAKASLAKTLAKIRPWKKAIEETADAH